MSDPQPDNVYNRLGDAAARGALACAKRIGIPCTFTHRNTPCVDIYAIVLEQGGNAERDGLGILRNASTVKLEIPVQPGVGIAGDCSMVICEGDSIECLGQTFYLQGEVEVLANGHIYRATFKKSQSITHGMRS